MRNYFLYPLEELSETSNNQALLNRFYHDIKMKAYMRVEGWGEGTLHHRVGCPLYHRKILTVFIGTR